MLQINPREFRGRGYISIVSKTVECISSCVEVSGFRRNYIKVSGEQSNSNTHSPCVSVGNVKSKRNLDEMHTQIVTEETSGKYSETIQYTQDIGL